MLCSLEVSSSPSFYQKNSVFSTDVLLVSSLWSHPAIFQVNGKAFIALEKKKSWFEFFTSINYLFYLGFYSFLIAQSWNKRRVVNISTDECTRNLDEKILPRKTNYFNSVKKNINVKLCWDFCTRKYLETRVTVFEIISSYFRVIFSPSLLSEALFSLPITKWAAALWKQWAGILLLILIG